MTCAASPRVSRHVHDRVLLRRRRGSEGVGDSSDHRETRLREKLNPNNNKPEFLCENKKLDPKTGLEDYVCSKNNFCEGDLVETETASWISGPRSR